MKARLHNGHREGAAGSGFNTARIPRSCHSLLRCAEGSRRLDVGGLREQSEGFRKELGGSIRVEGGGRSKSENNPVEEWLQPGLSLSVREWDHNNVAGCWVNQGKRLGLSCESRALPLKIHGPLRAGGTDGLGAEKAVGCVLAGFIELAGGAVRK